MKKKLGIIGLSALLSVSTMQAASAAGLWSEDFELGPSTPSSNPTTTELWSESLWEDEQPNTTPQTDSGSTPTDESTNLNTSQPNEQGNNQGSPYTELWSEDLWTEPDYDVPRTEPEQDNPATKPSAVELWTEPSYVELWSEPEYVEQWTDVVTTEQWAELVKTPEWSKAVETGQWADVVKTKEMQALQQTQSWDSLVEVQPISWMDVDSILERPPGEVSFDTPPVVEDGRTLVPLRTILDLTGAEMEWDNGTQTVTAKKGDITIALTIGSKTAFVNNKPVSLDTPAKIKDGRTLVPLRFVSEQLGYNVDYDTAARKVTINDKWHFSTDPKTYENKKTTPKTNASNSNSNDLIYGGLNDAQWNAMKIFEKYGASGGFGLNYWGQSGY